MAGSGGSSQQSGSTFQQRDPWGPTQPHLQSIMQTAEGLYRSGAGSDIWGGPAQSDQDWRTRQGISDATLIAQGENRPLMVLQDSLRGLGQTRDRAAGPTAADQYLPGLISQAGGQTSADRYVPGILSQIGGQTSAEQNLGRIASGADAGNNPHLNALLDANASRIGNRVNSSMSGAGRYGSFGHADALTRSINETNLPILAQSYENDRARQLQATGQIDASRQARAGIGLQGAGLLDSSRNTARGQQLQGVGLMDTSRRAADSQALQADQLGASLSPLYQSLQYAPSQTMMGIGQMLEGRTQRDLDARRQTFEQANAMPWTQLARYQGAVTGLGPLLQGMGTTQGTSSGSQENSMGWSDMLRFGANIGSMALPFLSDRNEKTDIKKVGTNEETGLDIYSYRYKGDPKSYPKVVGPMAQDIEKKYPGSTGLIDGKMYVKPEAAGLLGAL